MMYFRFYCGSVFLALLLSWPAAGQGIGPAPLKDGDRVVLLGSALIEHEQFHGYLETRLTRCFPQAGILFRNFGWSGDTVRGVARTGGFQNPDGFARLLKEVQAFKPTVIFIGYGMNESFEGPGGLPAFLAGFGNLLDRLGPLKARMVVLSPTFHEDLGRPFPDPARHNADLEQYTAALEKLSARRKLGFVDLFHPLANRKKAAGRRRLTTNGLLPNEAGYRLIAEEIERRLFGTFPAWSIELERSGKVLGLRGARLANLQAGAEGLRFEVLPARLPAPLTAPNPLPPSLKGKGWGLGAGREIGELPIIKIKDLVNREYVFRLNGREVQAGKWEGGVGLWPDPAQEQAEALRVAVVKKNALFYRRWRPFNDHERHWGFIGGDFQLYDAQVAEEETVIARLRRPGPLRCEILWKEKGK